MDVERYMKGCLLSFRYRARIGGGTGRSKQN
jgi:hypothetical protein